MHLTIPPLNQVPFMPGIFFFSARVEALLSRRADKRQRMQADIQALLMTE
jgi:hypothetical protein